MPQLSAWKVMSGNKTGLFRRMVQVRLAAPPKVPAR
jgi:hypothetical protein